MKCRRCKALAAVALPSHHAGFCPDCFRKFFLKQVETAIRRKKMILPEDKILVALSGGKDSLALMEALTRLGYQPVGLHVDLKIPGSSDVARKTVEDFCSRRGLRLIVADMEEWGLPIPEVRRKVKRPICSICGKIKRHAFNRIALEQGFDVLATGHNLDDETARLFANTLRWDEAHMAGQSPSLPAENGFARKIKPLYRLSEFETAAFAFLTDIEYTTAPCPYSRGASFTAHKALLAQLEARSPGSKISFYEGFLERGRPAFQNRDSDKEQLAPCQYCGMPTSAGACGVCRVRQLLQQS
ncbi:MAG: tRNA-5-methyluridine54 2-sulfurtransferase [Desulfovibrionales bacterium]|nr:tRNA-5-methyluridine54 2-sulfurtransferase [Desulfovibrionales bacterium]